MEKLRSRQVDTKGLWLLGGETTQQCTRLVGQLIDDGGSFGYLRMAYPRPIEYLAIENDT